MEVKASTFFVLAFIFLVGSWLSGIFLIPEKGIAGGLELGFISVFLGFIPAVLFVSLGIIQLIQKRKIKKQ